MNVYVFDLEGDGLLDSITRLHCLCYYDVNNGEGVKSLTSLDAIRDWLTGSDILIGHNIIRFDAPVLEKFLGIKIKAKLIDTLALSWYLEPERVKHGLEEWGEHFGVPKPAINDWQNLTVDEYIHRCSEDVKINTALWKRQRKQLTRLYGSWDEAKKFIDYLMFKMDCAREQERSRWKLDVEYALKTSQMLQETKEAKLAALTLAMPPIRRYAHRSRPTKPFKKDGSLSVAGAKWFALLEREGLPKDYNGVVNELVSEEPGNPGSSIQIKDWLYSLGWKPETFKYLRDKNTGELRKIPQINLEHGGGLCPSIKRMFDSYPGLRDLDSLGVINHRLALINGFLEFAGDKDSIQAQVGGLTNTLRFKHRVAVNLPKVGKPYGEEIRGALIAEDGYELCGADMSSLEDRLKQHFIYPYDPDYVNEMNKEDYDPHLALALLAKEVTEVEVEEYKSGVNKRIKPIRDIFKNGNYACQYGAGPARLALTANISVEKATFVWEIYWQKNWAIKEVAAAQTVKTINGQMWLLNPISNFWYSLRYEKDVFSTLVQGSASFVFDEWVRIFREKRPQLTAQFHDEVVLHVKKGNQEKCKKLLNEAIDILNKRLKLNRELGIGIQFGDRYSEIH